MLIKNTVIHPTDPNLQSRKVSTLRSLSRSWHCLGCSSKSHQTSSGARLSRDHPQAVQACPVVPPLTSDVFCASRNAEPTLRNKHRRQFVRAGEAERARGFSVSDGEDSARSHETSPWVETWHVGALTCCSASRSCRNCTSESRPRGMRNAIAQPRLKDRLVFPRNWYPMGIYM